MNQNLKVLDSLFDKALFLWVRRDPAFNIQSALEARQRQYGDMSSWYSFAVKEYKYLRDRPPLESVAGQIASINTSIETTLRQIPDNKKVIIDYELFCRNPAFYYNEIMDKVAALDGPGVVDASYRGKPTFECSNKWRLEKITHCEAEKAYEAAKKMIERGEMLCFS